MQFSIVQAEAEDAIKHGDRCGCGAGIGDGALHRAGEFEVGRRECIPADGI